MRTTYVILNNLFTKVIFIIFAEVARGLGGRDVNKLRSTIYQLLLVKSPSDTPERYPGDSKRISDINRL